MYIAVKKREQLQSYWELRVAAGETVWVKKQLWVYLRAARGSCGDCWSKKTVASYLRAAESGYKSLLVELTAVKIRAKTAGWEDSQNFHRLELWEENSWGEFRELNSEISGIRRKTTWCNKSETPLK